MFVFTSVVVVVLIGFNPSRVKRFLFVQRLSPATIIERNSNITHMLRLLPSRL